MSATTASLQRCDMISGYKNRQCAKMHGLGYSAHLVCSRSRNGRREFFPLGPTDGRQVLVRVAPWREALYLLRVPLGAPWSSLVSQVRSRWVKEGRKGDRTVADEYDLKEIAKKCRKSGMRLSAFPSRSLQLLQLR